MNRLLSQFAITENPRDCKPYGHGHINGTFLVTCDTGRKYILQSINTGIFTQPAQLMENFSAVTDHIAGKNQTTLHLIPTKDGKLFYQEPAGECWRLLDFVDSTICLQQVESAQDFYNTGLAFGQFQQYLADFPADTLYEVIANFHNTLSRYAQLHKAISVNFENRLSGCQSELEFALNREQEAGVIVEKLEQGLLPLRVTHNDTKLNNILFDATTRKPLCVIDLDTVMPGSVLYDFGDAIRFGASTAAEDEQDLSKVSCDMDLFRAYTEGFLAGCDGNLTELEIQMLPVGAKIITLECGIRFLTDYLNGDTYFRTQYPDQNLHRARTQFKLVADMESKWERMHTIVKEIAK